VSFNGSANINLPGVNTTGNQNTSGSSASTTGNAATATNVAYSGLTGTVPTWNQNTTGNAATATTLQTARTINGVSFNGSANIIVEPYVEDAVITSVTRYITFVDNSTAGYKRLNEDENLSYNPGTNVLTVPTVSGALSGNATTATTLQTARTIGGVSFNGSANINLPGVNSAGNQNTTGNAATATTLQTARTINGVSFNGSANITVADSTKLPLAGGTMTGLLAGRTTSGANVNTNNDTGSFSVRGDASNAASMTFHRIGAFAINMGLGTDNVFRIGGWSATANAFQMASNGDLTMAGNVTAYSDERLKKDWAATPTGFIKALVDSKHGTYTRIDSGERQAGVSAQDLQKAFPELVSVGTDNEQTLSVAYGNAALLAVIELAKEVAELRAEIKALKGE
jgi:hypothetical protein